MNNPTDPPPLREWYIRPRGGNGWPEAYHDDCPVEPRVHVREVPRTVPAISPEAVEHFRDGEGRLTGMFAIRPKSQELLDLELVSALVKSDDVICHKAALRINELLAIQATKGNTP